ncbi:MAG: universal stress protein [Deltaproteobacteria bacterium]|nr:universal stress protein [Deltaproteobacteria bacterium]
MDTDRITRLLVATDLSQNSSRIPDYASCLAKALGAEVTLTFVDPLADDGSGSEGHMSEYRSACREALEQQRRAIADSGVAVEAQAIRENFVVSGLLQATRRCGAEAIVVSRLGAHAGDQPHLVGSTPLRLLRQAEVPVIIVPTHVAPPERFCSLALPVVADGSLAVALEIGRQLAAQLELPLRPLRVRRRVTMPFSAAGSSLPAPEAASWTHHGVEIRDILAQRITSTIIGELAPSDLLIVVACDIDGPSVLGSAADRMLRQSMVTTIVLPRDYLLIHQRFVDSE